MPSTVMRAPGGLQAAAFRAICSRLTAVPVLPSPSSQCQFLVPLPTVGTRMESPAPPGTRMRLVPVQETAAWAGGADVSAGSRAIPDAAANVIVAATNWRILFIAGDTPGDLAAPGAHPRSWASP